jgi:hypothetical protein
MDAKQFVVDDDNEKLRKESMNDDEESPEEEMTKVNSESGSDEPGMTIYDPKKAQNKSKRPVLTLDIEAINEAYDERYKHQDVDKRIDTPSDIGEYLNQKENSP